jgi:hypothetical protein
MPASIMVLPTVIPIMIFPSKAVRCSRPCLGEDRRRDYDTHPDQIAAGTPDIFWQSHGFLLSGET